MSNSQKNSADNLPSVLLVGPSLGDGGAEGRFANLTTRLFVGQCHVAVLVNNSPSDVKMPQNFIDLHWRGRFSYPRLIWRLSRHIRRHRYRVAMAFGMFPCVVTILASMIARTGTKVVINEITRPKRVAESSWRGELYLLAYRTLYRYGDLITANSIDGLQETCELSGIPLAKGVRVENAIDAKRIAFLKHIKLDCHIPEVPFVICTTRLDFMKRVDTVIDAIYLVNQRIPCKLLIVGRGEAMAQLQQQVRVLALDNVVSFLGHVQNPFPILSRASVSVLASEFEGFSNSVLEAMFCDIPVVTSYCSSDARAMCLQKAALGFEIGDSRTLANHIISIIGDTELPKKLVKQAQLYREPHELNNTVSKYEHLILDVAT